MDIEFDRAKDAINIEKHGISLARAADFGDDIVFVDDDRFAEPRVRIYGLIDDQPHCAAAVFRGSKVRIINLRRAHEEEYRDHVG